MNTTDHLGPLKAVRKSGREAFRGAHGEAPFTLLAFWQWSGSDLVDNTYRGVLAEYLVAQALGISTAGVRESWTAFDLATDDGTKIEVKSASLLQSWGQRRHSAVQFVVPKRRGFDATANEFEALPRRHSDIYVFALLAHEDKRTVNPLDLTQWQFYVLPTRVLDERQRSQHSITLRSLQDLAGSAVDFWALSEAVQALASEIRESP